MTFLQYVPRKFGADRLDLISKVNAIIDRYTKKGLTLNRETSERRCLEELAEQ